MFLAYILMLDKVFPRRSKKHEQINIMLNVSKSLKYQLVISSREVFNIAAIMINEFADIDDVAKFLSELPYFVLENICGELDIPYSHFEDKHEFVNAIKANQDTHHSTHDELFAKLDVELKKLPA